METNTLPEYDTATMAFVLFMEYTEISTNGLIFPLKSFFDQVRVAAGKDTYTLDSPYTNKRACEMFKMEIG
jgi:hypothetical protein